MNIKLIPLTFLIFFQGISSASGKKFFINHRIIFRLANYDQNSFQLKFTKNILYKTGTQTPKFFNDQLSNNTIINRLIFISDSSAVKSPETYEYVPKWYSMITNLPEDMVGFYHQEFTTERIPAYLSIAALTGILIATDEHTYRQSNQFYHSSNFVKSASDVFVEIGDGRSQFGLAALFASYGFIAKDNRALTTASQIVEAVLASGAVVQVIKHLTGRESPDSETEPGGKWRFFPNQIQYHKHVSAYDAFPSGHLTTSLAAFVVIAENYPEQKWIYPATYIMSTLIGISMVNQGIHWYSDYPLAIALGYGFGKLIAHPVIKEEKSGNDKNPEISIKPYFDYYSKGFQISLRF